MSRHRALELQNGQVTLKTEAGWGGGLCGSGSENLLTTKSPPLQSAAQMLQDMARIQAEQKRMVSQGERWRPGKGAWVLEPWAEGVS